MTAHHSSHIAFLFPGQGSQAVGMGKELAALYPVAKETFDEADEALGYKLSQLCVEGPEDKLKLTEITQPAHADLLAWHRRLLELRWTEPMLTDGRMDRAQVRYDESQRWLVLERGPITLACNLGSMVRRILLPSTDPKLLMASQSGQTLEPGAVTLPPDSVVVVKN